MIHFSHVAYIGSSLDFRTEPDSKHFLNWTSCMSKRRSMIVSPRGVVHVCVCVCVFNGSFLTSIKSVFFFAPTVAMGYLRCINSSVLTAHLSNSKMTLCWKVFKVKAYHRVTTARSHSVDVGRPDVISHWVQFCESLLCAVCDLSEMIKLVHLRVIVIFICRAAHLHASKRQENKLLLWNKTIWFCDTQYVR